MNLPIYRAALEKIALFEGFQNFDVHIKSETMVPHTHTKLRWRPVKIGCAGVRSVSQNYSLPRLLC